MTRRDDILADARTALAAIVAGQAITGMGAAVFQSTVTTVERVLGSDPEELGRGLLPWIGVAPDPDRQPSPEWKFGKQSHEQLFLRLQVVAQGLPGEPRQTVVSKLAEDVVQALMADPTRGQNAIDTIPIMGPWSDECAPDLKKDGGRVTFQMVFQITYARNWNTTND